MSDIYGPWKSTNRSHPFFVVNHSEKKEIKFHLSVSQAD